jgi:hypothetical protein
VPVSNFWDKEKHRATNVDATMGLHLLDHYCKPWGRPSHSKTKVADIHGSLLVHVCTGSLKLAEMRKQTPKMATLGFHQKRRHFAASLLQR